MAFKYRSRTDIVSAILQTAERPTLKTKIMYNAYISYTQLKEYLETLTASELLRYDRVTETYVTTAKGKNFSEKCSALKEITALVQMT